MRFGENVTLKSQMNLKIRSPRVIRKAINKSKTLPQLVPQLISSLKICKMVVFPLPAVTVGKLLTEVGRNSTENIGCCTSKDHSKILIKKPAHFISIILSLSLVISSFFLSIYSVCFNVLKNMFSTLKERKETCIFLSEA